MSLDKNVWQQIPGSEEWLRVTDDVGIGYALYISPAGKRGPRGVYRPGFDHRWTIWFNGTLLAEGFTDDHYAARSAAMEKLGNVDFKVRDAIRAMDVRTKHGCKKWDDKGDCIECGMGAGSV